MQKLTWYVTLCPFLGVLDVLDYDSVSADIDHGVLIEHEYAWVHVWLETDHISEWCQINKGLTFRRE